MHGKIIGCGADAAGFGLAGEVRGQIRAQVGELSQPIIAGGVEPEDAAGIDVQVAVAVFDGQLRLADAAHAAEASGGGEQGRTDADGRAGCQRGVQIL